MAGANLAHSARFEFFYDRNDNAGVYGSTKAGRFFADADRFPTIRQWWAALKSRPSAQLVAREACRTFEMALAKGAHDKVVEYSL